MNKGRQSYIYAGVAIFFWSTVPTAFKISLGELDILPMLTIASIISSQGNPFSPGRSNITGVILALCSSVFFAVYFILNIKDKRDEAVKLFLNFLFASLYLVLTMIFTGKLPIEAGVKGVAGSVYIGIFEMGISFFFWLKALQLASDTAKISNLVYFSPFLSLIFIHFILHEHVYYTTPVGMFLIIFGILIQNRKPASI
jgi:drug/metabolite transporter (DMT)-like permease